MERNLIVYCLSDVDPAVLRAALEAVGLSPDSTTQYARGWTEGDSIEIEWFPGCGHCARGDVRRALASALVERGVSPVKLEWDDEAHGALVVDERPAHPSRYRHPGPSSCIGLFGDRQRVEGLRAVSASTGRGASSSGRALRHAHRLPHYFVAEEDVVDTGRFTVNGPGPMRGLLAQLTEEGMLERRTFPVPVTDPFDAPSSEVLYRVTSAGRALLAERGRRRPSWLRSAAETERRRARVERSDARGFAAVLESLQRGAA